MLRTKLGFARPLVVIAIFSVIAGAKVYAGCASPVVNSVTPNTGSTAGGTAVSISGANFFNPSTVTFGGVAATNVVVVNSTTITATTPAHAAGAVDVVVTDGGACIGATGRLPGGFTYAPAAPVPTLSPLVLALLAAILMLVGVFVMKK
jgi:hypothetical protein